MQGRLPDLREPYSIWFSSFVSQSAAGMASNGDCFFRMLAIAPRPRELTGAVDLVSHYQLKEQFEAFCKKPSPTSVSDSMYLGNVVGDSEFRRGEGMELCQLVQGSAGSWMPSDRVPFQHFDIELLRRAFALKETGPIFLPESERGLPTIRVKSKDQDEDKKKRKHKHRSKDREKAKDKEKKKDRDKDKKRDKDKDKDRSKGENGEKKHKKKKRRHDGEEGDDGHKHKSKKRKHSSKMEGQTILIKSGK
ncbi:uncharacterized protein [Physcomitrium patens]|uniref:Mediator of RNA polymerase II transcription subunit 19 n=1 Tax=Physcomitrium patens TaxID=3218 RepID=A0A2K1L098_PHYPA|nr:mediator of RNA polymerase II transcription subunit 19a-like [Physcomitrium patens]XP_024369022.1 mediator of RNA polymerase II transcription subunit 19a-like [Physcomitrium patens]XP_024369024.1 mediator of RNA polymerase II transcription subunit 19a-like [Physcomitrium patens]XP_024369025.1 mediator of RNA polymerase II transcription subunit 19a-like [Physcomitrium patens]XP_024369026.1 mediator of RNA polymerase II transcription subunit 19a-like [Physcomitrium patens]PNR59451.1 hypotheti|eukprot:XP_024369021.1 mediator of RNA polymerase II transcription subunit 19a-like [Physcomitrella patens]